MAALQAAYPAVKVTYTRFVNDILGNTKLDLALQGGSPIDIFFSYDVPRLNQRIGAGLAAELSSYINADRQISQWVSTNDGIVKTNNMYFNLPTSLAMGRRSSQY